MRRFSVYLSIFCISSRYRCTLSSTYPCYLLLSYYLPESSLCRKEALEAPPDRFLFQPWPVALICVLCVYTLVLIELVSWSPWSPWSLLLPFSRPEGSRNSLYISSRSKDCSRFELAELSDSSSSWLSFAFLPGLWVSRRRMGYVFPSSLLFK